MKISLDTNILIDNPEVVFDSSREFVISFTVLRELDKLKRNPDLKHAAQQAIRNIKVQLLANKIIILNVPSIDALGHSPDEQIIHDTLAAEAHFLTEDINASVIAQSLGITLSDFEAESLIDYSYTGYKNVPTTDEYNKSLRVLKDMPLEEFEHHMNVQLKLNEYCVITDSAISPDIWKRKDKAVVRISQKMSPFTSAGVKGVQPLDPVQMCVLDAVMDSTCSLTVIDGILGTGKTMLTMMAALAVTQGEKRYSYYDQIYITASPESVNKNLYTGYKPGTSEQKLGGHLGGFKSNLKFLLDPQRVKESRKSQNPPEDSLLPSDIAWVDYFTIVEIDEMQGTSLHHSILLVDEYQKLNADSLKLILSRIAEGSKVVLMGDTQGQVYGLNRAAEGFKVLYKELGMATEFNYIKLENIYRSELAKFVAKIFK
jgi:predicted ribonuclease YlaK